MMQTPQPVEQAPGQAQAGAVDSGVGGAAAQDVCPAQDPAPAQLLQQEERGEGVKPKPSETEAAGGSSEAESEDEFDTELAMWLAGKLQHLQPGTELTLDSVKVLGRLLDEITERVLDKARQVNTGEADNEVGSTAAAACMSDAASAAAAKPQVQGRRGKQQQKLSALTSLDIHKACKRVLPEPVGNHSHLLKQAWHLDKQSLKGIKRQKQAAASSAVDEIGSGVSKENERQQQQQAALLP